MTLTRLVASALLVAVMIVRTDAIAAAQDGADGARLALVLGEADYPQARLPTAAADAGLMATALAQAGFDVTAVADAGIAPLRRTIAVFAAKVRAAGPRTSVAVYISGYGLQYGGENWLAPVDVRIDRGEDIPDVALKLSDLTAPLEAVPARTRLFLFDIARETPFAREGSRPAPGLALAEAPVGSVYAFNTAPGAVAPPDVPPYGAYARALAEAMQEPGATVGQMLQHVRLRTSERTDGAAVPFDDGAADAPFAFVPGAAVPASPRAAIASLPPADAYSAVVAQDTLPGYVDFLAAFPRDPLSSRVRAMGAVRREAQIWSEAVRDNTPRAYWTYLRRYPRGPHFLDVRRKLYDLHAALEPPSRFDVVAFEGLPPPAAGDTAILDHPFPTFSDPDGPAVPVPPGTLLPPPRTAFFEALPPAPPPLQGALALPLPVDRAISAAMPTGQVVQPEVPAGLLVATVIRSRDGSALVTSKSDGTVLSRLFATAARDARTIDARTADGQLLATVAIGAANDGGLTMTSAGPAGAPIGRSVSRDAARGADRLTMLYDSDNLPLATTVVSPDGIVLASGFVPGRAPPRPLVFTSHLDAKGKSVVALEPAAEIKLPPRPTDVPTVARADVSSPDILPASPAMPVTPGLTGRAPALDLPPAPTTPAFDAAAAPVSAPAQNEVVPGPGSKPNAAGAAPNAEAATAPPAPIVPSPAPASSTILPVRPPLPPPRATARAKKGVGH